VIGDVQRLIERETPRELRIFSRRDPIDSGRSFVIAMQVDARETPGLHGLRA
jgi:hypothetical protein